MRIIPNNPTALSTNTDNAASKRFSVCLVTYQARRKSPPTELGIKLLKNRPKKWSRTATNSGKWTR